MRRLLPVLLALGCISALQGFAQEKDAPIPPRFQALAKNDHFRLLRVLGTPEVPPIHHEASAFSADGKRAIYAEDLSTGTADTPHMRTRLLLWDMVSKAWPREIDLDGKTVTAMGFSGDGRKVLLGGLMLVDKEKSPRVFLSLCDLDLGKEIKTVLTKEKFVFAVALAPDETTALAGGSENVKRWDLKQGKELASYGEKVSGGGTLTYLPGGKQFLTGWNTEGVQLWDIDKKKPSRIFRSKDKKDRFILGLSASRDGKRFAAADMADLVFSVTLWETGAGKEINSLRLVKQAVTEIVTAVALAGDGKTVLSVWSKPDPAADDFACARLVAWNGETNKILWSHAVPYRGRAPMLVQGDKLLVGGGPNLFETWSIKDGKRLESWGGHKGTVNTLAVLPNGDFLSAGQEGVVMTWSKGQVVSKRAAHAGAISVMAMGPDRKRWLTGGADQTIKLWSADADKPIHEFKGHTSSVTSLAFSKDGQWACSGSGDRGVKTWDLKTGKEIATCMGHSEGVNAVAISPDDRWIASASDDATIRVWPIKDGKPDPDREVITLDDHKKAVTCLAFSPDGMTLVSGSQDQTLIVWDWAKEKVLRTIPGHKNWITSLLFVDANTLVTTSDDLTMCWWELVSGKEIGRIDFGAVGDCPRCLARIGTDRLLVGSSSWLIYEVQMLKSKAGAGSSNK